LARPIEKLREPCVFASFDRERRTRDDQPQRGCSPRSIPRTVLPTISWTSSELARDPRSSSLTGCAGSGLAGQPAHRRRPRRSIRARPDGAGTPDRVDRAAASAAGPGTSQDVSLRCTRRGRRRKNRQPGPLAPRRTCE
jgi:hypothetical protein